MIEPHLIIIYCQWFENPYHAFRPHEMQRTSSYVIVYAGTLYTLSRKLNVDWIMDNSTLELTVRRGGKKNNIGRKNGIWNCVPACVLIHRCTANNNHPQWSAWRQCFQFCLCVWGISNVTTHRPVQTCSFGDPPHPGPGSTHPNQHGDPLGPSPEPPIPVQTYSLVTPPPNLLKFVHYVSHTFIDKRMVGFQLKWLLVDFTF